MTDLCVWMFEKFCFNGELLVERPRLSVFSEKIVPDSQLVFLYELASGYELWHVIPGFAGPHFAVGCYNSLPTDVVAGPLAVGSCDSGHRLTSGGHCCRVV